jgi:hypothetical protein
MLKVHQRRLLGTVDSKRDNSRRQCSKLTVRVEQLVSQGFGC